MWSGKEQPLSQDAHRAALSLERGGCWVGGGGESGADVALCLGFGQARGRLWPSLCSPVTPPGHCPPATSAGNRTQSLLRIKGQPASIQPGLELRLGLRGSSPTWPDLQPSLGEEAGEGTACGPQFLRLFQPSPCLRQARSQTPLKHCCLCSQGSPSVSPSERTGGPHPQA